MVVFCVYRELEYYYHTYMYIINISQSRKKLNAVYWLCASIYFIFCESRKKDNLTHSYIVFMQTR